jgi:CubicO group peptidase (beta-lactamase class C family)
MSGRIAFPPATGPLSAEEFAYREDDPTGQRVAAIALARMRGQSAGARQVGRPRARNDDPGAQLERLRRARRDAAEEIARSVRPVSAAVRACGLDLPASQVARDLRKQRGRDRATPVRRLTVTGPDTGGRAPFQFFGGVASHDGPDVFASFPGLALSPTSPATHGSGFVYRWRFRSGPTNDGLGGDPFYEECLEQAEQSYRPAYVHLVPPGPGDSWASYNALFVQDDDSAYQFTGGILRRQSDSWNLDVSDLQWFAGTLQSALDPDGGAAAGWRPISIAAARYDQKLWLFGPIVEKTDYAVVWLRDGTDAADHRVLFAAPGELEEQAAEFLAAKFRPFSGVTTNEGSVTLWIRDEVDQWVLRPSFASFAAFDLPHGYRPIHIADGIVIGVRQNDNSFWTMSEAESDELGAFMSDVNALDLQAPCFGRGDGGIWNVGIYGPRRGINELPVVTGTPIEDFVTAGDVELDRWLREDMMATKDISAAVLAVARDGEIVVNRGYTFGTQSEKLTQPDTPFRIASVSKPITAVAVMRLIEEHQGLQSAINMNTPVFEIPGMPQPVGYTDEVFEIRIRDLLQHRCGWGENPPADPDDPEDDGGSTDGFDGPVGFSMAQLEGDLGVPFQYFTRSQLVAYGLDSSGYDPLDRFGFVAEHVRTEFRYSNFGYMLLAEMIEVISGLSYWDFVRSRILEPLSMASTRLAVSSRFHAPRSEPNYLGDKRYMGDIAVGAKQGFAPSFYGLWSGDSSAYELPDAYGGSTLLESVDAAGGWVSTASDMISFLRAFDGYESGAGMRAANEEILSPQSLSCESLELI